MYTTYGRDQLGGKRNAASGTSIMKVPLKSSGRHPRSVRVDFTEATRD